MQPLHVVVEQSAGDIGQFGRAGSCVREAPTEDFSRHGLLQKTGHVAFSMFLGETPRWYKLTVIAWFLLNPLLLVVAGSYATSWVISLGKQC